MPTPSGATGICTGTPLASIMTVGWRVRAGIDIINQRSNKKDRSKSAVRRPAIHRRPCRRKRIGCRRRHPIPSLPDCSKTRRNGGDNQGWQLLGMMNCLVNFVTLAIFLYYSLVLYVYSGSHRRRAKSLNDGCERHARRQAGSKDVTKPRDSRLRDECVESGCGCKSKFCLVELWPEHLVMNIS